MAIISSDRSDWRLANRPDAVEDHTYAIVRDPGGDVTTVIAPVMHDDALFR